MHFFKQIWAKWGKALSLMLFFTISAYCASAQLSGTYTVGSSGNYSTLTAAVSDLNTSGISGAVTLLLTDATYSSSETFPIVINQISGASASNRITIRPASSVNATITGSTSSGAALIKLNGADFITINGSNTIGGTTRNLTIKNTSTSTTTAAIWVSSLGTGKGATQDSIKNVNIAAGSNSATSTFGIYAGGTAISTSGTGADNDTLIIQNNNISKAYYGIYARGVSSTGLLDKLLITNNLIGSDTASQYVTYRGVDVQNATAPEISSNTIFNLKLTTSVNNAAIDLGQYNSDAIVSKNLITGIYSTSSGGWGAYGINISSATGNSGITIANNMISDIITSNYSATSTTYNAFGIRITGGTGIKVYYNSVHLSGVPSTGTTGTLSAAIVVTAGSGMDIRNNIFSNIMTGLSGAKSYAIYLSATSNFTTINYNDYWVSGANGVLGRIGSTDYTTLSDWQTATSQDANSLSANPRFVSNTNLHARAAAINGKATPISGITTDFDNETRSTTAPDMGADEFTPPPVDAALSLFVSPTVSCAGTQNVTVRLRNSGTNKLDTVTITYLLNGVQQTSKQYYPGITSGNTTDIVVGTIALSNTSKTLKAYVSDPNNVSDADPSNDTITMSIRAALGAGTYTIGGISPDYSTFTAALNDLVSRGICGAVTFNVANGIYREKLTFPEISGASATNTITFKSASGDSSKVILIDSSSTSSTDNYLVQLNGADYITFSKITFYRAGANTYGRVIEITGAANSNRFLNNQIIGTINTSTTNSAALVYSAAGTGSKDDNNIFRNNLLKYGSYGFYYFGQSTTVHEYGTVIEGNIIDSTNYHAINLENQDSAQVLSNIISNVNGATAFGINLRYLEVKSSIQKNKIDVPNGTKGMHLEYTRGTAANPLVIANNFISLGGTSTSGRALDIDYNQYLKFYYNSVNMYGTGSTASAVYLWSGTGSTYGNITMKNNNFANTGGGYAVEITATAVGLPYIDTSDYNNYYTSGSTFGKWGGTTVTDLAGWKTASSLDANSVSVNPRYTSNTDLHTKAIGLNAKATPIAGITTDIDGQTRNSSTPDIGADEFTPPANDLAAIAIISPSNRFCGDSATKIRMVITNLGTNSQSGFNVVAKITGLTTQTFTYSYTGTLASLKNDTITFASSLNTYQGGTYNLSVYTTLSTDQDRTNDTVKTTFVADAIPANPTPKNTAICSGNTAQLVAGKPSGSSLQWFTSSSASTPVFTGDTLTTPVLTSSSTYYVSASFAKPGSVGPSTNTSVSTSGGYTKSTYKVYFDAINPLKLDSVAVIANGTGTVTIELYNSSNTLITSAAGNVSLANTKVFIPLGFTVPSGTGYYLQLNTSNTTPSLYRNTSGASYPYTSSAISITGNSFDPDYYYYFYDWQYTAAGCPSPRVPVTVTVNKAPAGVAIKKGSVFNGTFNTGSPVDPDRVCAGSTINYELTPPTGLTNAGFGTTWTITNISFATANGTPAKDTVITYPSSSGNGNLKFNPIASLADSTLILNITVKNLSTGCDTSFSRYVSVGYQPIAKFSANNVCNGSGMTFTDSSTSNASTKYLYYFGDGRTSSVKNPVHFYNLPGTYNVSLVLSNQNGCTDSVVKTVTVFPTPKADFTVANACGTNKIQITNNSTISIGSLTYLWKFGNGDTSLRQNPVYSYPAPGTYTIKLVVSGNNSCKDSITKSITVFPAPVANFSADTTTCQGLSMRFSDSSKAVNGGLSRLWNFGDGGTSTAANPFHAFATPGTYNVKLIVTTLDGCEDSMTKQITVNAAPDADFTAISTTCSGENVVFTNTSSISAGTITSYQWSFGDGNTSTLQNPTHIYANAGGYTVKLVITSNTGCMDSISKQVKVNNAAVANFASVSVCSNSSAQFIDSSSVNGGTIVNRLWIFGDGDSSTAVNPSHKYDSAGTYNVTLVVTSNTGCTDSVTKAVSIFAMPVAGFTTADVCEGNDVVFTNTSSIANDTLTYLWIFGDGDSSTAKNPVHRYDSAGAYNVTLLAMTANRCADTISVRVNVYAAPSAKFTANVNGADVTFMPADSALISYTWYFGDGDSSTLMDPQHTYTADSLYTVRLKVKNRNGCEAEYSDTVRVKSTGIFAAAKAEIALNIFPNPFREQTNIVYTLEKAARVKAVVYDMNGKEVAVLADQNQSAGNYNYTLDAISNKMNSGLYLIRIMVDNQVITKQIVRLK